MSARRGKICSDWNAIFPIGQDICISLSPFLKRGCRERYRLLLVFFQLLVWDGSVEKAGNVVEVG